MSNAKIQPTLPLPLEQLLIPAGFTITKVEVDDTYITIHYSNEDLVCELLVLRK